MPRFPKPWFRSDRNAWYVQLDRKQVCLGPDQADAMRRYHALMATPRRASVPSHTVLTVTDEFLEWTRQHRAPRTFDWYRDRCQRFIETIPADLAVSQLCPYHVQQWVDRHRNWAPGMKRGCIIAIQRALNWAEKQGLIERSPIRHIEKPSPGRRTEIITSAEFQHLLNAARAEHFKDSVVTAWETGARPQELTRVEARHVDLANSRWIFPPEEAKVKSRPRVVYLTEAAQTITERLLNRWPSGPLFRNCRGRAWHPYALNCAFQRLKPKLDRKLCLYTFRHSFATRLLQAGVDPLTVAILLGHANPAMLSTTYQHLSLNPSHLLAQVRRAK